jgi:formylmethanofuran dehydrogenase subunit C
MSGWTLRARSAIPADGLRFDMRGVTPSALAPLSHAEVERVPIVCAAQSIALAELFHVEPAGDDGHLVFDADLSRFDRVGFALDAGTLVVGGSVGDYAGALMRGGVLHVHGSAGDLAACEMAGGELRIDGDVGAFAAAPRAGGMDGMRGGTLVVRGNAGARLCDRMRRGSVLVHGAAGDFAASRMVAGTLALGGACGVHAGYGMRRGSVVFAGAAPQSPLTFVPSIDGAPVFWQLLARDLSRHGGVFADLPQRGIQRWRGDRAASGHGEWIVAT